MKLTKEECEIAIELIKKSYSEGEFQFDYDEIILLEHLIEYHFKLEESYKVMVMECEKMLNHIERLTSNPPLKFEELKEGMWVWDNKTKEYIVCSPNINVMGQRCVCYWCGYTFLDGEFDEDYIIFEEKRFFRKEFQKND